MQSILILLIGIALLIYGARWLVDGASSLARRLGISALAVGLTVVAFGTSAPELVVNLIASVQGRADIAIGNIIGSNLANILIILGIAALIYPLRVQHSTAWKAIPMSLLAVLVVGVIANDVVLDHASSLVLGRGDGLMLLAFFIIFMYYTYGIRKQEATAEHAAPAVRMYPGALTLLMIVGGLILLVVGGKFTVDGAVAIARVLGVSEALIGFTIVAIGTSLPELATSAVAAYRRQVDIAVGNVVGSNIFNIFFILGISATVRAIPFAPAFNTDLLFLVVATLVLFLALFVGRRHVLQRWQGAGFVGFYIVYLVFLVARG